MVLAASIRGSYLSCNCDAGCFALPGSSAQPSRSQTSGGVHPGPARRPRQLLPTAAAADLLLEDQFFFHPSVTATCPPASCPRSKTSARSAWRAAPGQAQEMAAAGQLGSEPHALGAVAGTELSVRRVSVPRRPECSARRRAPAQSATAVAMLAVLAACVFATAPAHALAANARPAHFAGSAGGMGDTLGPMEGLAGAPAAVPEAATPLRHGYQYLGRVRFVDAARGGVPVVDLGSAPSAAAASALAGGTGTEAAAEVPQQHHTVLVTADGHRFTKRYAAQGLRWPAFPPTGLLSTVAQACEHPCWAFAFTCCCKRRCTPAPIMISSARRKFITIAWHNTVPVSCDQTLCLGRASRLAGALVPWPELLPLGRFLNAPAQLPSLMLTLTLWR